MFTHSHRYVECVGTTFDDPEYDRLLREFVSEHPQEFEAWRSVERALFESRAGLGAYPDQLLMKSCQAHIRKKLVDLTGGLAASHVWRVLRGRIVRSLLQDDPSLHPAPGKVLIMEPRTCTDAELVALVKNFGANHPSLWERWSRVEAAFDKWVDDPLREVSFEFHRFVREHCWVMSNSAISMAFSAVRGLYFPKIHSTALN